MNDKKMISIDQFSDEERLAVNEVLQNLMQKHRQRTGNAPAKNLMQKKRKS